jgi:protein ImuA
MAMAAVRRSELIEDLRERIRRIERRPPRRTAFEATGLPEVDALLPGGGFPRGALSEIVGGPGSGKTALCLAAMARVMRGEGLAAFVDGRGELYPPAAAALGVDLSRLLIVRPEPEGVARGRSSSPPAATALWAAEALLASGAFEVVAMDLPLLAARPGRTSPSGPGRAGAEAMVRRLLAAAEKGGVVGLWIAVPRGPGRWARVPAAVRLEVVRGPDGPTVRRDLARGAVAPVPLEAEAEGEEAGGGA